MPDIYPVIEWQNNQTPVAQRYGDVYYSAANGLAESQHTFLAGVGIGDSTWPSEMVQHTPLCVGELGLGTGLNLCATLHAWQTAGQPVSLHYVAIEGHPLTPHDMARALHPFATELGPIAEQWQTIWNNHFWPHCHTSPTMLFCHTKQVVPGFTLSLLAGDINDVWPLWPPDIPSIHAWYLDGFTPSKNPAMWTNAVFYHIAQHSQPGTRLATFTAAGHVRRGLQAAGFAVTKRAGYGTKRECLAAAYCQESS